MGECANQKMSLFNNKLIDIRTFLSRKPAEGKVSEFFHIRPTDWPIDRRRNLVLAQDTAVELGNPRDASTAFLFWVDDPSLVRHGKITIVGPDLPALANRQVSFGRVVIAGVEGFNTENCYERYREMELLRYDLHLKGYMMRGVSQYQREWSRVSREAVGNGFSLKTLGGAMIDRVSSLDYVRAAEVVFVTSSREDVLELQKISEPIMNVIGAMNKMAEEMSLECDTCEYNTVCGDVAELRSMRNELKNKETSSNG